MTVHLSPREIEVATMTANGMTKEYIAYLLGICPGTVEIYRRTIREKLEAHTMVEAIAKCVMLQIITPDMVSFRFEVDAETSSGN